jgi:acetyl-CoA carboxylase biotin carboxyl carrier protein
MKDPKLNLDEIRRLLGLFDRNSLSELEVEEDGVKITLRRHAPSTMQEPMVAIPAGNPEFAHVVSEEVSAPEEQALPSNVIEILSPMTGVFYRTPAPTEPLFIEIGDEVQVGQTVGIIEAMKVFSEVPADVAGRVVAIPAQSGELIQQGKPLVILEPLDS